jgi:quinohemoprotein ethanol dehydrogenase
MAWHPGRELLYIPVLDIPTVATHGADDEWTDTLEIFTEVEGKPFSPGKLIAWDPVTQTERWSVAHTLPFNGGVLATAGNLVFQGNAEGRFAAYAADTGEEQWSLLTGSSITAAPVSYALDGQQFILIPIGAGGGIQSGYPQLGGNEDSAGPTRLLAFSLDGGSAMPAIRTVARTLPEQPKLSASAATLASGKQLFAQNCGGCHGKGGAARIGGSMPDLRYATSETHATWHGIVIGGARRANGMPGFDHLDTAQSEAIRNYVLSLSEAIRESADSR